MQLVKIKTLTDLQKAWRTFSQDKAGFVEYNIRKSVTDQDFSTEMCGYIAVDM